MPTRSRNLLTRDRRSPRGSTSRIILQIANIREYPNRDSVKDRSDRPSLRRHEPLQIGEPVQHDFKLPRTGSVPHSPINDADELLAIGRDVIITFELRAALSVRSRIYPHRITKRKRRLRCDVHRKVLATPAIENLRS